MFEGVPDQFHPFSASRTSTLLPLPFQASSVPFHGASATASTFSSFDPYSPPPQVLQTTFLHPNDKHDRNHKEDDRSNSPLAANFEVGRQRSVARPPPEPALPWSNDEVLALLRIRSGLENWPPEFTWEHVSRKLAQLGFKRSPEKCKEKFEEESRFFNCNINYTKTFRGLSELEELCNHGDRHHHDSDNSNIAADSDQKTSKSDQAGEENDLRKKRDEIAENQRSRKRKRQKKFEVFKRFCEDFVGKMMAEQEKLHNKLVADMVRRDEEKVAKEEAWKMQELERINKELEIRAQEQATVGDRQTTIINYLKTFTSFQPSSIPTQENSSSSSLQKTHQNPNPQSKIHGETSEKNHQNPNSSSYKDDTGKRWPRDEVLALINLRCKLNNGVDENKEGVPTKAPLWERISVGMIELGYKRSAKRCKEKWENINKYFRKTKDTNKKRSVDSRTCPYFHELTTLYSQGKLAGNRAESPENGSVLPETGQVSGSSQNGSTNSSMQHGEGEKTMVHHVPSFDFEF